MCGEINKIIGTCPYCLKLTNLTRKYFYFDIKCECHSPQHFEIIEHCMSCTPKMPTYTEITFKKDFINRHYLEHVKDKSRIYFSEFKVSPSPCLSDESKLWIPSNLITNGSGYEIKEVSDIEE